MNKLSVEKLLLISFLLLSSYFLNAQSHKMAASFTGGYVQDGLGGMVTLDYKLNEFDFLQFNLQANFTNLETGNVEIPVDLYAFNGGYFFDVIRNNSRIFALSLGGGATIGYEIINNGDDSIDGQILLIEDKSKLVFGAYVGLDADIFIIPTIAINIKANEVYHANSEIGEFSPYLGLGVKLILF
ncbi:conjugal transfer protein TraO [Aquimarina sp. 2201CG5-10]|uniref:conjugal transfer protein TraO n=1 Tax=Aquimarina callyspongiae TaxID=3098150 RepID=UPI002AB4DB5B|nr:conjugal transfer protein TraO [Aquimarina sp. 2201CG5-10]MDY8135524.1 conjugal transfer protein TraO [Aquimarina sp. 2201CG5-10]